MSEHLSENCITAILNHTLSPEDEATAFDHWRGCEFCRTKLRLAISRPSFLPSTLARGDRLFGVWIGDRWPLGIIGTASQLLAVTLSQKEYLRSTDFLSRQGFSIEYDNPPVFISRSRTTLIQFLENGHPYRITGFNLFLVKGEFSRQVLAWTGLVRFGRTAAYSEIAYWMDRPRAARSVGGALHSNPLVLVIPCHRIIGADGSLVGFGGGLTLKRQLLELEGSLPSKITRPLKNPPKISPI